MGVNNKKLSTNGRNLLKKLEGVRNYIYNDSGGYPTIGVGHLIQPGEDFSDGITDAQIEDLLTKDLVRFEAAVNDTMLVPLNQDQFDALVIHAFNIGTGAFRKSTLAAIINRKGTADEIRKWWTSHYLTSGGVYVQGLYNRRVVEADLFLGSYSLKPSAVALLVIVLLCFVGIWIYLY